MNVVNQLACFICSTQKRSSESFALLRWRLWSSPWALLFAHWNWIGARPVRFSENHFATLPPGSPLPSESDCASRVRRSGWEPHSENDRANRTAGVSCSEIRTCAVWSQDLYVYAARVDGRFSGTTDEILQWGACKWGIDEDVLRARAAEESGWRQSSSGDRTSKRTRL